MPENDTKNPNRCSVCRADPFERCYSNGFPGEILPHAMRPSGDTIGSLPPKGYCEPATPGELKAHREEKRISDLSDDEIIGESLNDLGLHDYRDLSPIPVRSSAAIAGWTAHGLRSGWTAHGIRSHDLVDPGCTYVCTAFPHRPFRARYLIVTTVGFFIEQVTVGNIMVVGQVSGDLYMTARWDELERIGALERVKLDAPAANIGNKLGISVKNELNCPRRFDAALIGEEIIS